jgi:hypothetical protein
MVVAAIGVDPSGTVLRSFALAADRWNGPDPRDQLGDVVAVAAGQARSQWDAVGLDDHMMLAASSAPSTGDGPVFAPPFIARTCEPSTAAREKSRMLAARSSASTDAWYATTRHGRKAHAR